MNDYKECADDVDINQIDGVTATSFLGSGDNANISYANIPETKTYYPSMDEFSSPLHFIQSIRDEAMKYGIIKIVPPKEWKPSFNLSFDDFKFSTKIQPIHLIERRVNGGSLSSFNLAETRSRFLSNIRVFLDDASIDDVILNKKKVHLYDLYSKVTLYGGYFKMCKDKIWKNVATELGVEWVGNNVPSAHLVKLCYELYLLDYEQTNHFPSIKRDIEINNRPKEKYKNILRNKPDKIGQIKRCNDPNVTINDLNQFQTCSVCGQLPDHYNVTNVILECIQCGNRWHAQCHEPPIPLHDLQMLIQQQQQQNGNNGTSVQLNWSCTSCTIQRKAKFGYQTSGQTYSLKEYQQRAQQFKKNFLAAQGRTECTPTEWENIFWSVVDNGCYPLSVEYGSEIPSKPEMTGFPMDDDYYSQHEFNLMNIKKAKGNILQYLGRDISGMTYPWIYVGSLMTAFGWHYEDHYAYSVNFNHFGATKQWYGIPGLNADAAENAMKEILNGHFEQFDLVTLVSPLLLSQKYRIPIYKARQNAGEFIVTFPQAYHCGFNLGFNVAEAVNFATSDWLSYGLKCCERYRLYGRRQAFAHNELVCNLCQRLEILDMTTLKWLFESFLFVYKSHYEFIKTMLSANVTRGRPWEYDPKKWVKLKKDNQKDSLLLFDHLQNIDCLPDINNKDGTGRMRYDDNVSFDEFDDDSDDDDIDSNKQREERHEDAECVKCHHCVYVGCVRCKCDPSVVCCHKHFADFCNCPISSKWFEFRFNLSWFEDILQKLSIKVAANYNNYSMNNQIKELQTDISHKNYQILTHSTDKYVLDISCHITANLVRNEFEERYGKILGDYSNQLVAKLSSRFPQLSKRRMSQDELNHLRHACECVVWAHFNDAVSNGNLIEVRRYFEILCDYNNVSKMLFDAWRCYSDVQKFYTQLQNLQGQQDKIALLLQNQPRFPKKLSLKGIEFALQRCNQGEIKVDMQQITAAMPNILQFMHQQEQILQNALNGILSTTSECKWNLNIQARTIVNFIPGNFSHSYWTWLQTHIPQILSGNNDNHRTPPSEEEKNTCIVLPILKWLLGEFERGILASIDCDAMNALKRVIRKGKKYILVINKFYKNKNGDCYLTQNELNKMMRVCTKLRLRLPYWEFMQLRHKEYMQWKKRVNAILNQSKNKNGNALNQNGENLKCSFADLCNLVTQYTEYRILDKKGDILKRLLSPIKKWQNCAKAKLLNVENNDSDLYDLLIEFEPYTSIITEPSEQYLAIMQKLGISKWIETVYNELNNQQFIIENVEKIQNLIQIGSKYKIKRTLQYSEALMIRLNELTQFYAECELKLTQMEGPNKKENDIKMFQKIIQTAHNLKIDISKNETLCKLQSNIQKVEEWQQYLQRTLDKLPQIQMNNDLDILMNGNGHNRKRNLSQIEVEFEEKQQQKEAQPKRKRRRLNYDHVPILLWQSAINEDCANEFDASCDYKAIRAQRLNENDIISELKQICEKSSLIACRSELEKEAEVRLVSMTKCVDECNAFIEKIGGDKNKLLAMSEGEMERMRQIAESVLNKTEIEFKIKALHWRWNGIRYLAQRNKAKERKESVEVDDGERKEENVQNSKAEMNVDVDGDVEKKEKKEMVESKEDVQNSKVEMDVDDDNKEMVESKQESVEQDAMKENVQSIQIDGDDQKEKVGIDEKEMENEGNNIDGKKVSIDADDKNETEMKNEENEENNSDDKKVSSNADDVKEAEMKTEENVENSEQNEENENEKDGDVLMKDAENLEQKAENLQNEESKENDEVIEQKEESGKPKDEQMDAQKEKVNDDDVKDGDVAIVSVENQKETVTTDINENMDKEKEQNEEDKATNLEEQEQKAMNVAIANEENTQNEVNKEEGTVNVDEKSENIENKEEKEEEIEITNYWSIQKLFYEGAQLALTIEDAAEWEQICPFFNNVSKFERISTDLFVFGNADCNELLSINANVEKIKQTIIDCMEERGQNNENNDNKQYIERLDQTISQMNKICKRIQIFLKFFDDNFKKEKLTNANLDLLAKELDLLSQCVKKESIPHFDAIESSTKFMESVFEKLTFLYSSRPHTAKCSLLQWINFNFMQFCIMYRNFGRIQMDKYRSNKVNNCYCFCRFSYSESNENDENLPDMIGCDECGEWYHGECIMLDEKIMKKLLNTKKTRFICPRCCYYEYNDKYTYFPSLHWNANLVPLSALENALKTDENGNEILCDCDVINAVKRLISWIKQWQLDVNKFIDSICLTHKVLADFDDEQTFIVEYLLNCGQISGVFTAELLLLKILMRFIGKSQIWNNHDGVRQLRLDELKSKVIENELMPKYKTKSKLLTDFLCSIAEDIKKSKLLLQDLFIDLYLIKSIGVHYTTHMRRKKKGPLRVKLILQRLESVTKKEVEECDELRENKVTLEQEGDQYVHAQFENDNRWLKYVNESISMKKADKTHFQQKWLQRLNSYRDNLKNKYKNSRLQIQSVVITMDLLAKLMEG